MFIVLGIYNFGGGEQEWKKEESSEFPAKFQLFHSFLAVAVNVLEETAREYLIQLGSLGMTVTGWKRKQFFKLQDLQ